MPFGGMLTMGLIGAGTSIFGAVTGASAAKKAAAAQAAAAAAAGKKVEGAVQDSNPQIINNAANASDMALRAGGQVLDAGKGALAAGQTASDNTYTAAGNANKLLDPYATSGAAANDTLSAGLKAGGDFNKTPTLSDLQMDPSFDFIRKNQEQIMARQQQARGGSMSGAAFKDLANYDEGALSQQYQQAFNNFQTSTKNRFDALNTVAGRGLTASTTEGGNLTDAAKTAGGFTTDAAKTNLLANQSNLQANEFAGGETYDAAKVTAGNTIKGAEDAASYLTQGANAQASGIVGSANAVNQGLSGVANSVTGAITGYNNNQNFNNYLKNPASSTFTPYGSAKPFNPAATAVNPYYSQFSFDNVPPVLSAGAR